MGGGKYSIRDLFDLFVSCSLYLNLNSVLILIISAVYLGGGYFAADTGIVTAIAVMTFIYVVDRLNVTEEDKINNPGRSALVRKYRTELFGLSVVAFSLFELSLFVTVFSPDLSGAGALALAHVPLAVLALYDEIKTVPLPLDSLAVAFTWGYMLVFIYVFISPLSVGILEGAGLFCGWFLIVFAGLEARNAKDIEGDREAGKVTLASRFGCDQTKRIEIALKSVGVLVLVALSGSPVVLALLICHIGLLRLFGSLETDFREEGSGEPLDSGRISGD
ncbi:UbiA family prenyltransferase [Haloarcula sp. JP-L23]|uniref:UbiA family prenyltransferase n=1 Tax=Haloarcula sp. JP-L23 TaxID=2716717 RepID=UPI00140EC858|nr:UbiA family prenyltransferase [Haloarcula sp. JP-L23]